MNPIDSTAEWIEADGLGGFASGTVSGIRSRRYHAVLLTATTPPAGRMVLVNGFDAWVETPNGTVALSSQRYGPDVIHPDGATRIESFEYEPWPRWRAGVANPGYSRYHIEGAAVFERPGFSFYASREWFVPFRYRTEWRRRDLSILRRRSGYHGAFERPIRARSGVVPQFSLL
jgi:glycogen debranching enzyme